MLFLYLITPFLGTFRNYVKYKQIKFWMFIRTPITYFLINLVFQKNNVLSKLGALAVRMFAFILSLILPLLALGAVATVDAVANHQEEERGPNDVEPEFKGSPLEGWMNYNGDYCDKEGKTTYYD